MARLTRRVAMVTGGASGLGADIAKRLAIEEATVIVSDIQTPKDGTEIDHHFLRHDVTDETQWVTALKSVIERHGRLDILINNAGIVGPRDRASPEDTELTDWAQIFRVNVEGVFLGCKHAIKSMRRQPAGGVIINVSSIAGMLASPFATAYGASKSAVRHLTKSVAQYCAEQKLRIRCNSVHPGNVRTPLWEAGTRQAAQARGMTFDRLLADAESLVPLGDFTRPGDVSAAIAFLVSDDARHITGTALAVDGGVLDCDTFRLSRS